MAEVLIRSGSNPRTLASLPKRSGWWCCLQPQPAGCAAPAICADRLLDQVQSGTGHCDAMADGGGLGAEDIGVTMGHTLSVCQATHWLVHRQVRQCCKMANDSPRHAGRQEPRQHCTDWRMNVCAACRTGPACRIATPRRSPCPAECHNGYFNTVYSGVWFVLCTGNVSCLWCVYRHRRTIGSRR